METTADQKSKHEQARARRDWEQLWKQKQTQPELKTQSTNWGGKRRGAGRPPLDVNRCACGRHTLTRAIMLRLRCRRPVEEQS
jgi:hypothetical protein